MSARSTHAWLALALAASIPAACTSLQRTYGTPLPTSGATVTPSPGASGTFGATATPSSSASPSGAPTAPSGCATQNPTATLVAMVSFITATPDPTYGTLNGYAVETNGTAPVVAEPIRVPTGTLLQFQNGESDSSPEILHSAVGFPGGSFPQPPYTFPGGTDVSVGSTIGSPQWSTGRVAPGCYSSAFTVPTTGTYYFGDYDFYNTSNTRDVIVVSSP